ncbi:MAG: acyl-CoA reductase [Chitinophagales bacterium]|nr:acyl-CoA reductase [Chitinophagales bacterium]MCO5281818.1 acyl-CoA reductase [Chitinophagales bacterium]OJV29794.1 MAG: hypothetical protein BGO32_11630 [Bacteroidetes bacterium 37-13]HRN95561.1 acyl-CoA reductase [Chitinophagales bacterium]HRP38942.1 acyl-CoA reductase [Chitinophagales bacterium]
MSIKNRIELLDKIGQKLSAMPETQAIISEAAKQNTWFTPEFSQSSISAICTEFLQAEKLSAWLKPYFIEDNFKLNKTVGIIAAGNVPLVGFHDFLCCYILGVSAQFKLSSKDTLLTRFVIQQILNEDKAYAQQFSFVEKLQNFDAVIATGSASSNRYFEHYFSKYPNILRSNRVSVAVLNGNETAQDLQMLANDIFQYFGLGCRNIAKLFIPDSFDTAKLFENFSAYSWLHQNSNFMNNYDYNRTILLMNKTPHQANDFVMLQENTDLHSPIATLYFERYTDFSEVEKKLNVQQNQIQCVVGLQSGMIPFGKAQQPTLSDYADGKDTIGFLLGL